MKQLPRAALLAAALLLTACGGGGNEGESGETAVTATGPADAQVVTVVSNDKLEFEPATVNAKVGTLALTHRNGGSIPHNLVFDDKGLGGTETLTEGKEETLTLTFKNAGTYDFVCTIHSGQDGKVVVS
jgi:plastocyanin